MAHEASARGDNGLWDFKPIGFIQSVFHFKNGTPRQPSVCSFARGSLTITKDVFNNPEHALEGLEEFSHVWLVFLFHKNSGLHCKAKVKPPRLNGKRVGVFSTRSPHRPNAIGLSLVHLEAVKGATLYLSGLDLLDGTPVLDVKPYIPAYDCPAPTPSLSSPSLCQLAATSEDGSDAGIASDAEGVCSHSAAVTSNSSSCGSGHGDARSTECEKSLVVGECHSGSHGDAVVPKDCHSLSKAENKTLGTGAGELESELNQSENFACPLESHIQHHSGHTITSVSADTLLSNTQTKSSDGSSVLCSGNMASENEENKNNPLSCRPQILEHDTCRATSSTESDSRLRGEEENCKGEEGSDEADDSRNATAPMGAGSREITPSNLTSPQAVSTAQWVRRPPVSRLSVRFTERALQQLSRFSPASSDPQYRLQLLGDAARVREGVEQVLQEDPRSVYRRQRCQDSLYFFTLDTVHVTCWFDQGVAEVVRVLPTSLVPHCQPAAT